MFLRAAKTLKARARKARGSKPNPRKFPVERPQAERGPNPEPKENEDRVRGADADAAGDGGDAASPMQSSPVPAKGGKRMVRAMTSAAKARRNNRVGMRRHSPMCWLHFQRRIQSGDWSWFQRQV
jgi:hypothetical protein